VTGGVRRAANRREMIAPGKAGARRVPREAGSFNIQSEKETEENVCNLEDLTAIVLLISHSCFSSGAYAREIELFVATPLQPCGAGTVAHALVHRRPRPCAPPPTPLCTAAHNPGRRR